MFDYAYVKQMFEKDNYTLISESYNSFSDKLDTICPNGHSYATSFKNFRGGRRCPKCRQVSFKDKKDYIESLGYVVLSNEDELVGCRAKIKVMCHEGHVSEKRYDHFKSGNGCKECADNAKRNDINNVRDYISDYGYELLDNEYTKNNRPLNMKCPMGHTCKISYSNFTNGNRCKECCHENYRLDINDIRFEFEKEGYTLISTTYKNNSEKLDLICPEGHSCKISHANFIHGSVRCSKCINLNVSRGEKMIIEVLQSRNVKFVQQYKFDSCKDKKSLPFDFYLTELNTIIEFDGEQHFTYKGRFGSEESFYSTIYHDAIKNAFCEDNNIDLIRIPYWEYNNIEKIISQVLE